jgi:hypothetical protein
MVSDKTFRVFVIDPSEKLHRLSLLSWEAMTLGREYLPELKNSVIRVAVVWLEMAEDQPKRILEISGERWHLDSFGRVDQIILDAFTEDFRQEVDKAFGHGGAERKTDDGSVIDLSEFFKARHINYRLSWKPIDRDVTQIINDIWPETAGTKVDRAQYLKAGSRKTKPLTHRAKIAKAEIWEPIFRINRAIGTLGPVDLRSLADHISKRLDDPVSHLENKIYAGILDGIEFEIARHRAWNRNKGTWYAVCQIVDEEADDRWRCDEVEEIKCASKREAEAACRKLLKKYADHFSERSTVDVEMRPQIEWEP